MLLAGDLVDAVEATTRAAHHTTIVVLYAYLIGAQCLRLADVQRLCMAYYITNSLDFLASNSQVKNKNMYMCI